MGVVSEPASLLDHQRRASAEAKGPRVPAEGLKLAALGWSHKVRCGLRIWQDPKTGFFKGEDVAYEMANRRGANG